MSKDDKNTPSEGANKKQKKMTDQINKTQKESKGHKFKNKDLKHLRDKGML